MGNTIDSMRLLSTIDWRDFFEQVSLIDPLLSQDPAGVYAQMEFATRDRYRHVIERISKRTNIEEVKIAKAAIDLAIKAGVGYQVPGVSKRKAGAVSGEPQSAKREPAPDTGHLTPTADTQHQHLLPMSGTTWLMRASHNLRPSLAINQV